MERGGICCVFDKYCQSSCMNTLGEQFCYLIVSKIRIILVKKFLFG